MFRYLIKNRSSPHAPLWNSSWWNENNFHSSLKSLRSNKRSCRGGKETNSTETANKFSNEGLVLVDQIGKKSRSSYHCVFKCLMDSLVGKGFCAGVVYVSGGKVTEICMSKTITKMQKNLLHLVDRFINFNLNSHILTWIILGTFIQSVKLPNVNIREGSSLTDLHTFLERNQSFLSFVVCKRFSAVMHDWAVIIGCAQIRINHLFGVLAELA